MHMLMSLICNVMALDCAASHEVSQLVGTHERSAQLSQARKARSARRHLNAYHARQPSLDTAQTQDSSSEKAQ